MPDFVVCGIYVFLLHILQDANFTTALELAVRFGKTLVIQEVDGVEPVLYPLLRGDLTSQGKVYTQTDQFNSTVKPVLKGQGHLSCRDTFYWILRCPLKTCFTVFAIFVCFTWKLIYFVLLSVRFVYFECYYDFTRNKEL